MSNEGTVVRVDPATLIVAANVRSNTKLTKEFVASVKQHGVLVPITAQEAEDGLRVVDGQRRTLAAVEAGVQEVPVFVVAPLEDAARIVDQVVVNEHRAELDDVEQVLAMKELEQLGVSAAAIARRTGAKRKLVDGALAVAASEAATAALRDQQLSFDAAIAVAEFEGDPAAQERIVRMGASSYSIAQERERRAREERKAQLEADGVQVIDRPDYDDARTREINRVYLDEGMTRPLGDLEHDELVKIAGDGLRAYVYLAWSSQMDGREVQVGYAVSGWQDRGLVGRELSTSSAPKPETPEEIAAAKEERRRARESTKAWTTSTTVRVAWLQEVLQRRSMPKGWELLAARQALGELWGYPWSTVLGLLGLSRSDNGLGKYDVVKYLDEHPAKAAQVALALALGSIEGARDFDRKGWQSSGAKAYLELLASWSYELSDVERELVGERVAAAA